MFLRQFIQTVLGLVLLVTSSFALSNTEFTYNVIDGGIEVTGCVGTCPTDLVIPDSIDGFNVISIGEDAFTYNQLVTVTIPDSVTNIDEDAFSYNQITSVKFSTNLTTIGHAAFGTNQLTSITIPDSVTRIEHVAFTLNRLTNIKFLGDRPEIILGAFASNIDLDNISYCSGATGWPGDAIEDIVPQLNDTCETQNYQSEPIQYATFDIDQSGSVDALTDGLILLRYFFGLRGDALINNVISPDANRASSADIEAYIESHMP